MKKLSLLCVPLLAATLIFSALAVSVNTAPLNQAQAAAKTVPQWIWLGNPTDSTETVYFRHSFELNSVPESATVAGSCDNAMSVFVNGKKVVSSNEWSTPVLSLIHI